MIICSQKAKNCILCTYTQALPEIDSKITTFLSLTAKFREPTLQFSIYIYNEYMFVYTLHF